MNETRDREQASEIQRRIDILHQLETNRGQPTYHQARKRAAQDLDLSERSLRRLQHIYRTQGPSGLHRPERADAGHHKTDLAWQDYIIKRYRQGNRGMRQTSRAQIAKQVEIHAAAQGYSHYPSRRTVYRILAPLIQEQEQKQKRHHIGWIGETLTLTSKTGSEIAIDHSNQVWQCDHTPADIYIVDCQGEILGRPTLTTVIDTYSRCIMGIHLGMDPPSASVTGLALRHAILPKTYPPSYHLHHDWESQGIPQYLYTDSGSDFTSHHLEHIANQLGIVLCHRHRPSQGGIIERPFGTLNQDFFSQLPGYTTARATPHQNAIKAEAILTLEQLETLLIRYIVDNYNQRIDPRDRHQSRISRWRNGQMSLRQPRDARELDGLLLRQQNRRVYQGGYIRFANLVYRGEYLSGYAGAEIVIRYDPRDITTLWVYQAHKHHDEFLTRAHAQNLETEHLSLSDAKAISRRLRETQRAISNQSILNEIRDRHHYIDTLSEPIDETPAISSDASDTSKPSTSPKPLPEIRVYDYEQLRQSHGH
ncbi:Mu transposase C-terminal domain-containing protein [Leptolyngbya sp. CCY15150]|uniref:Mu transposase C-terminal domain-containing protein n=1 Tax=Leptolyngbya sp. CCY15150 TaxID=2767772 RepID=UPI001951DFA8